MSREAILEGNLRALTARDPALAAALAATAPLPTLVSPTPSGHPTLAVEHVLLHNRADPRREATRWASEQRAALDACRATTAGVLGFALGYHVEALAAVWPGRIVVFEPDRRLLRTALGARDLRALLERVTLISEPVPDDAALVDVTPVPHAPSLLRKGTGLRALKDRIAARAVLHDLRLRILVVSPLAGGSYPLTTFCARALAQAGHHVSVLDLAAFASGLGALPQFTTRRAGRAAVGEAWSKFLGTGILAAVDEAQPDVVLAMAQAPLDAGVLRECGRRGIVRALWFVEDHRLFDYWRQVAADYDHLFVIQEGFVPVAARETAGQVTYLPCAADPSVHRPLALTAAERAAWGAPIGFVGAGYRNRRLAFRSLLDLGLKIWGTEWGGSGPLEAVVQQGGARIATEDTVRIFNATEVNLNLHSSTYVDGVDPRGDFVNPRTFEIAAAGAFQLVDRRALLPALFDPGAELATFTDAAELPELAAHYLARPDERATLAAAARARVLAGHTYAHRMQRLLEVVCARDAERLRARPRAETVQQVAAQEGDRPLGRLLARLPPGTPCTLDGIVRELQDREGDLSDPEAICLFLHQFDELYVREHRS